MTNLISFFKINCKSVKGYYCGLTRVEVGMFRRNSVNGIVYDVTMCEFKGRTIYKIVHFALGVTYADARAAFKRQVDCLIDLMI